MDIGSGSGELLYFAKKAGFDVFGIEPNQGYAEFCRDKLSLPIFNGTYEEADIEDSTYDLIFMNDSPLFKINLKGDVCEWFKQHAWKVCVL